MPLAFHSYNITPDALNIQNTQNEYSISQYQFLTFLVKITMFYLCLIKTVVSSKNYYLYQSNRKN